MLETVGIMLGGFLAFVLVLMGFGYIYQVIDIYFRGGSFRVATKLRSALAEIEPIKKVPRELWIIYALKFLESYGYFSMSLVLTLFLSKEFGYTDVNAGYAYGIFGVLTSAFGLVVGFVIDNLGVRKCLLVGHLFLTAGRVGLALTQSKPFMQGMLYFVIPFGMSLGIPVMTTGIRRYTDESNKTIAFAMFYQMMNLAALVSGPMVDGLRESMDENKTGYMTAYRVIILTGGITSFTGLLISLFFVREVSLSKPGAVEVFKPVRGSPWAISKQLLREKNFYRFLVFVTLLIGVKMVFRHLDATFPKYMIRSFGTKVPFGTVYAINPFLIIILVPIIATKTKNFDVVNTILVGAYISSASVFFVMWRSLAGSILFIIALSIGEAIWSPRLMEYTTTIAPVGREGTYSSLASVPFFVAKFFVGSLGGTLLEKYCPENSTCEDGWLVWLYIGFSTISSPLLITAFYWFIKPPKVPPTPSSLEMQETQNHNTDDEADENAPGPVEDEPSRKETKGRSALLKKTQLDDTDV